MKVLAIRTDFKHHGEDSGYKQILKYTHPYKVIGINERDINTPVPVLKLKYQWLFELEAFKYRKEIDLVHILYGEDYLRWSPRLFKNIPVVATFHQPVEILEREVMYGDIRGRIGRLTHLFSKKRFERLSAAIITNASQKEVLKKVMPEEKIHLIPLGIYFETLKDQYNKHIPKEHSGHILTVGNWLRDWDFYFKVVEKCPQLKFVLVNRNLEEKYKKLAKSFSNLHYPDKISDAELSNLYLNAALHFVPVTGLAGSNALLQGLALGCPLVLTDVNAEEFHNQDKFCFLYKKGNVEDCVNKFEKFMNSSDENKAEYRKNAHLYASQFSWEEIAKKTVELYNKLI